MMDLHSALRHLLKLLMFGLNMSRYVFSQLNTRLSGSPHIISQIHEKADGYHKGWPLYDVVKQLMPGGAKGKKVYQGRKATDPSTSSMVLPGGAAVAAPANASTVRQSDGNGDTSGEYNAGRASAGEHDVSGDMAGESGAGHESAVGTANGRSGEPILDGDNDDNHNVAPTSPPPSSSITSKCRFSAAVEDAHTTSSSHVTSSQNTGTASHTSSGSAKRGQMTGAIAITTLGHGLADLTSTYCKGLEEEQLQHQE